MTEGLACLGYLAHSAMTPTHRIRSPKKRESDGFPPRALGVKNGRSPMVDTALWRSDEKRPTMLGYAGFK
jgi:hypothetical protein